MNSIVEEVTEPKLAPPGAGLPIVELYVARLLFGFKRATGNREKFNAGFAEERRAIAGLVKRCGEDGGRRVLIRRLRGLEDSSRYWSVWMTLEHLRIVHSSITQVLLGLAAGRVPPGAASTAAVKPSPNVAREVIGEYERSCDEMLKAVTGFSNLRTKARYTHPWFGPLDAFGWHALSATHLGIHRRQIQRIVGAL